MSTVVDTRAAGIDYNAHAAGYARHRVVNPRVVAALIAQTPITANSDVLDVGCGTGNYAAALVTATGCRISGIDPSPKMLDVARSAVSWQQLREGRAERLPFADRSFDLVMTTDVIHHVRDRAAFFGEAARVLRLGGRIVTVTDSDDDIRGRRPLSSHFPETVEIELRRYPPLSTLMAELDAAGFSAMRTTRVAFDYDLESIDAYRGRAFSSLLLIDDAAFARGIARLEAELARGPVRCRSLYTLLWGTWPGAKVPSQPTEGIDHQW